MFCFSIEKASHSEQRDFSFFHECWATLLDIEEHTVIIQPVSQEQDSHYLSTSLRHAPDIPLAKNKSYIKAATGVPLS